MLVKIVKSKISIEELKQIAKANGYSEMVKAAVDVERGVMALGGGLHADCSEILFEDGSKGENVWGINIYFNKDRVKGDWIEYNSLTNVKPLTNRSLEIEDNAVKEKIKKIVNQLVI